MRRRNPIQTIYVSVNNGPQEDSLREKKSFSFSLSLFYFKDEAPVALHGRNNPGAAAGISSWAQPLAVSLRSSVWTHSSAS